MMSTLAQDWEAYVNWDNSTKSTDELSMSMTMKLKKLDDDRFMICFTTPSGNYSEVIADYGDLYDVLGHLFAENDGIVEQLFK